jgi:hypothetical protein
MSRTRDLLRKVFIPNNAGTSWLVILRIGTALALSGKLLSEFGFRSDLYGSQGFVPHDIAVFSQNPHIPTILGLYSNISLYCHCMEWTFIKIFFIIGLAAALSLLMGSMTRIAAFLCWSMMAIIFNSSHLTSYGFDAILLTLLFYCLIFPVGKYFSLDSKIWAKVLAPDDSFTTIYHKTIQIHVCLIYFVNGISKTHGSGWLDGRGMWDAINQPQFHSLLTPFLLKLFMIPYVPVIISASIILIEIAYPFLIWVRGINKVILLLIILLHVLIALIMGLWLFAFTMIVINLVAFGHVLSKEKVING